MPIEYVLLIGSLLILVSIALAKISDNLGVPTLLLFLGIGMLSGSEGPGDIYFDDARLAQSVGIIALVFILFAGGLDTKWSEVKPVFWQATSLATLGVFITALAVGLFASYCVEHFFTQRFVAWSSRIIHRCCSSLLCSSLEECEFTWQPQAIVGTRVR